jgi:hypothetical protein
LVVIVIDDEHQLRFRSGPRIPAGPGMITPLVHQRVAGPGHYVSRLDGPKADSADGPLDCQDLCRPSSLGHRTVVDRQTLDQTIFRVSRR